jgi:hypothetical protein
MWLPVRHQKTYVNVNNHCTQGKRWFKRYVSQKSFHERFWVLCASHIIDYSSPKSRVVKSNILSKVTSRYAVSCHISIIPIIRITTTHNNSSYYSFSIHSYDFEKFRVQIASGLSGSRVFTSRHRSCRPRWRSVGLVVKLCSWQSATLSSVGWREVVILSRPPFVDSGEEG